MKKRAKLQSLVGLVLILAVISGPVLGGLITELLSWNWVFIFNILLGAPTLALVIWQFPKIAAEDKDHGLDAMGSVTLVLGATPIVFVLTMGGVHYPWNSGQIIASIGFGLTMLALFIVVEKKVEHPMMPMEIYSKRIIKTSVIIMACINSVLYGTILYIPLFLQAVQGASATESGTFLIALMLGLVLGLLVAGQIIGRTEKAFYRLLTLGGTGISTTGMYLLSTLTAATSFSLLLLYIGVLGVGIGMVMSTVMLVVQHSMPAHLLKIAISVMHFFRGLGGMAGTVVLGFVMSLGFIHHLNRAMNEQLKTMLPSNWERLINDNWQVFLDQTELDSAFEGLAHLQIELNSHMLETLHDSVSISLLSSIQGVFWGGTVLAAISFVAAFFIREPDDVHLED